MSESSVLQETLAVAKDLRADNEELQNALKQLQTEYNALEKRCAQVFDERDDALESKVETETECKRLYESWSEQLQKQAEEFAAIQTQMIPAKQIHQMRATLLQELEAPYTSKLQYLQKALEQSNAERHNALRALEVLRTQHRDLKAKHSETTQEFSQQKTLSQTRVSSLESELREYRISEKNGSLREDLSELRMENKCLREESQRAKDAHSGELLECEKKRMQLICEVKECRGQLRIAESQKRSDAERVAEYKSETKESKEEMRECQSQIRSFRKSITDLETELKSARNATLKREAECVAESRLRLAEARQQTSDIQAVADECMAEVRALRKNKEMDQCKWRQYVAQNSARQSDLQQCQRELESQRAKIRALTKEKAAAVSELQSDAQKSGEAMDALMTENRELIAEMQLIESQLRNQGSERDQMAEAQLRQVTAENKELAQIVHKFKTDRSRYKRLAHSAKHKIEAMAVEIEKLKLQKNADDSENAQSVKQFIAELHLTES